VLLLNLILLLRCLIHKESPFCYLFIRKTRETIRCFDELVRNKLVYVLRFSEQGFVKVVVSAYEIYIQSLLTLNGIISCYNNLITKNRGMNYFLEN